MKREEIPLLPYLDPRPAQEAAASPIANAVNIPFAELDARMGELPPRGIAIRVVGEAEAAEAVAWLRDHGRKAVQIVKYSPADHVNYGRLWQPNPWLWIWMTTRRIHERPPGNAFDLGCGGGREAVYLAAHKWLVDAVDRLPESPERNREFAKHYLDEERQHLIRWQTADVLDSAFEPQGKYDLITSFFFFDRALILRAKEWLKPGGELVIEAFTTLRQTQEGKPTSPDRVVKPGEMRDLLTGLDIEKLEEGDHGRGHTVRVWARKGY
jgi:tellurite methyltransferase